MLHCIAQHHAIYDDRECNAEEGRDALHYLVAVVLFAVLFGEEC